ncbi:MAG: prephenate dehydrogenase/arogenate dehydrogenase family protein [Sedimentisphaerales bacterium]|nr:prephenate dehydrogenase/arogenate dehydrogenase family protein [Sedimentisphaerales bacterium]
MKINELESVTIVGLGLLGGSVGLAIDRVFPHIKRVGFSHRQVTRDKALEAEVVDLVYNNIPEAVRDADLVILASPIGTFSDLLGQMAEHLRDTAVVTDVGSTKVLPVRWGQKKLKGKVEFLGSHPMAGSEQRGVEFARADLFDGAHCILTPTEATKNSTVKLLSDFWEALGMLVCQMSPNEHDKVLARISHLPHVLAAALINCNDLEQMMLCGKGFLDTTRIASGPAGVWRDILMANASNGAAAVGRLIRELQKVQKTLKEKDEKKIVQMLTKAQLKRNELIEKKMLRKELPE